MHRQYADQNHNATPSPKRRTARASARMAGVAVTALIAFSLAGCGATIGNMTTSSLFGQSSQHQAAAAQTTATGTLPAAPAQPTSTPTSRAMHVGALTARATKCGYNFDPTQLKAAFFAAEAAAGTPPTQNALLEQAYNVAFNGVNKVATTEANYCNANKTKTIKQDLTRALAGDFTPPVVKKPKVAQSDGIFGALFDPDTDTEERGPAYGSSEWWDSQADKAGR